MGSVDIIVPCYNYARFLRGCVLSALGQHGVKVRVLIIDDASSDETPKVGMELAAGDGCVEYRRHAFNCGHVSTYNEGLDWARGEYTVVLSADDLLAPGSLSRAVKLMDAHPEVGLSYGRGIVFRSDQPPPYAWPGTEECGWKILAGSQFLESCCAEGNNLVCTPTAIVRTELQKRLGGYRRDLPHTCDMEMWMRFAAHAHVGVLDADQAYYRVHSASMSVQWYESVLPDLKQRKAAFEALFEDHGDLIADRRTLQLSANRAVSWAAFWGASRAFESGDLTGCQAMLEYALAINPELRDRPEYARLRWKRWIGPKAWSALRGPIGYLRGRPARYAQGIC